MASWKITCIQIKGEREVGSLDSSVLKKSTTKRSLDQIQHLETFFQQNEFINGERRLELAQLTNLSADQVSIWFRNQRQKKKQEKDGADQQVFKNHRNEVKTDRKRMLLFMTAIWRFLATFLPYVCFYFTKLRFRRSFSYAQQVWILIGSKAMV